ncbi:uncharacterized protein Z520_11002 [Fonsecaea multimorphosa CBS 102226]|uniref:Domain of unknown function at the cortex 1 domain-containing protein n=1 Tax=Fonsecaea multimorphosa CBS 102226 TaxID=1442371 RepID=A0A0D2JSF8_9EURO|nr:uncharacterized protein Z520_11002 [Fonsecaea multimorphosa CBS 102226]KIX93359.1 hypothetical protein Z520_11002 [Fonsecaea multimorphosa CBS 102226]OAL18595.1 hypothetical protein AYO22_10572 [Fonsecaea multimorphosa]
MGDSSSPNEVQASHHTQYRLRVTAGPSYDAATHKTVPVNSSETLTFETSSIILSVCVRIRHFTGFPPSSPVTAEKYFSSDLHKYDQYSISFSFVPKQDIPGEELVFGNDFDRPIRDRLPPGFNQAFRIVKWWIDPGLDGDVYADRPYLYGPALSSFNILRICDEVIPKDQLPSPPPSSDAENKEDDEKKADGDETHAWKIPAEHTQDFHSAIVEEGGEGTGLAVRSEANIPSDSPARQKHFLNRTNLSSFTFERGRLYQSDFGNPYLDFNDFSLKLPGFSLNVIQYVDSKTHELRYTLKNKRSGEVYGVVVFTLLFGDELREASREYGSDNKKGAAGVEGKEEEPPKESENIPDDEDDID